MKRGKRQVQQLQGDEHSQQHNFSQPQINYFQNLGNHSLETPTGIGNNQSSLQVKKLQTRTQAEKCKQQNIAKVQEMDQKKKKIQLLKQKYLKKNKPEQNKNQPFAIEKVTPSTIKQQINQKPTQLSKIQKQSQPVKPVLPVRIEKVQTLIPVQQLKKTQFPTLQIYKPARNQIPHTLKIQLPQPIDRQIPQAANNQVLKPVKYQIPKPTNRIHPRNPPPSLGKKSFLSPAPQKLQQIDVQEGRSGKQVSWSQAQSLRHGQSKGQSYPRNESQDSGSQNKSDKLTDKALAPVPLQTPTLAITTQKKPINAPPPPPNKNMKDILNKKFSSNKQIPKPPNRALNPTNQNKFLFSQQQKPLQLNHGAQSSQGGPPNADGYNTIKMQSEVVVEIDEQFNVDSNMSTLPVSKLVRPTTNKAKKSVNQHVQPIKFIGEWLGSPQITLEQLFPQLKQTIEFYCLNKHVPLEVTSMNSTFTFLIGEVVQAFIINNCVRLTEDQKSVAEALCLNFFYLSPVQFSDTFLVALIKLGDGYLQKYGKALQDRLQIYLRKLILFKNLLLNEQIDTFVNYCLYKKLVNQSNFIYYLMLASQNSQLITLISNTQIHDLKYSLAVLSFCKLNLKNKSLMGLYLRLILNLAPLFTHNGLVQKVLNHIKQLDIPENLYQFSKQLKLRLLKSYDDKSQLEDRNSREQGSGMNNSMNQPVKDTGLFGYFNINKAIDKIKTSTQKALGAVEKQMKPQQQEKKDQIVYDPIKKRYIINGQIPQDENGFNDESEQTKRKAPPPPPLGGKKKAPPPPPMQGKKPVARIASNRYV